jgi:nucleoid DNA-binding protein
MAGKAMTPSRPVTLKHLAARLAADHELTKREGEAILGDLVSLITKHLKKGERIRIAGFGRPHGTQPRDRRSDQDQSEQENRIPASQALEDGGLTAGADT